MTDKSTANSKISRSLGIPLGATEWLFLLGLLFLSIGVSFLFGWAWALTIGGGVVLATAYFNAIQPGE